MERSRLMFDTISFKYPHQISSQYSSCFVSKAFHNRQSQSFRQTAGASLASRQSLAALSVALAMPKNNFVLETKIGILIAFV